VWKESSPSIANISSGQTLHRKSGEEMFPIKKSIFQRRTLGFERVWFVMKANGVESISVLCEGKSVLVFALVLKMCVESR
jgi:hypothetical protein